MRKYATPVGFDASGCWRVSRLFLAFSQRKDRLNHDQWGTGRGELLRSEYQHSTSRPGNPSRCTRARSASPGARESELRGMAELGMAVGSRSEGAPGRFSPFARRHDLVGAVASNRPRPAHRSIRLECQVITFEEPLAALPALGVELKDVDELLSAPALYLRVLYVLSTGLLWRQGAHSLEI
jgi:hypothetical protein